MCLIAVSKKIQPLPSQNATCLSVVISKMNNTTWILLKYHYSYTLRAGRALRDNVVQCFIDERHQGPEKLKWLC